MSPWKLFRPDPMQAPAAKLYGAIVAQARLPAFYLAGGVPDSIDGRFEMVALHCFLVLRRLRGAGEAAERLAQNLVDAFFGDMDASLREMGAGDLGVGKRVKRMATAFYGRLAAYESAQAPASLAEALRRNLYGTAAPTAAQLASVVEYTQATGPRLARQSLEDILAGRPDFPAWSTTS
jgi:cytochrome b pre-mRNA-processing protein 3